MNLDYAYNPATRQIQDVYVLLQIAHLILQLIERGNLLSEEYKRLFGSLCNLDRRLAESIRNQVIAPDAADPAAGLIQIRLDSS